MNSFSYKKTFIMNIALSGMFSISFLLFFFLNIDYVEATLAEKIFNVYVLVVPIVTAIALYKKSAKLLRKSALALNLINALLALDLIAKSIYVGVPNAVVIMLILLIPTLINIRYFIYASKAIRV
jgi:hypothetical protein